VGVESNPSFQTYLPRTDVESITFQIKEATKFGGDGFGFAFDNILWGNVQVDFWQSPS